MKTSTLRQLLATLAVGIAMPFPGPVSAFEADVHFGLTRWLAQRAGFSAEQAESIAMGDQRVDGGLVDSNQLDLEYACAGRFPAIARQAQRDRFPSAKPVPAPPEERVVEAGSAAAHQALTELTATSKGKEGLLLGKFGHALHPLQDSWSHQGIPSQPQAARSLGGCDASLASNHPAARGGPDSHIADLTMRWPAETLAMAHSTYDELLKWGNIEGQPRKPALWDSLVQPIGEFSKASTKTQKRAWFLAQGMTDTQFLDGISLPDGPDPGDLQWRGRMLPPLPGIASQQHDAPADVRAFFDRFLSRWLGTERIEDVVADMGPGRTPPPRDGDEVPPSPAELIARLKVWKLRDHGAAAELAHAPTPLSAAQLKAIDRLTRKPAAYVPPMVVSDAVYSLQPATPEPMPMLPYIVRALPPIGATQRMIAIARLKHAPYDTVGWIVEQQGKRWVLVGMVSSVDM
jgi:hypothetical protein